MIVDVHYQSQYLLSEQKHGYGPNVHLLDNPVLHTLLAKLCASETKQPIINQLVQTLYQNLVQVIVNAEFPKSTQKVITRMASAHPDQGVFQARLLEPKVRVVSVNLARAGTFPSHLCYDTFNYLFDPQLVRQDHVTVSRTTDQQGHVTGSTIAGSKIGGDVQDAFVVFPDPMGATGSTIIEALQVYKNQVKGRPAKFIGLHLIVTPEYVRNVLAAHPDVVIYAIRLDRGFSTPKALAALPGTYPQEERGLNDHQYIVPGGGGFGEILNNSFV